MIDRWWGIGIGAAWKVAEVEEGSTVAIFGLGAVGLAVFQIKPHLPVALGDDFNGHTHPRIIHYASLIDCYIISGRGGGKAPGSFKDHRCRFESRKI